MNYNILNIIIGFMISDFIVLNLKQGMVLDKKGCKTHMKNKLNVVSIIICILIVAAIIAINHFFEQYKAFSVALFVLLVVVIFWKKDKSEKN